MAQSSRPTTPTKPWRTRQGGSSSSSVSSSTSTIQSNRSTNNYHQTSQPKLSSDSNYVPKTHGSFGMLIIGIGGANGTTLLSGIIANRNNVKWYGPRGEGPFSPNYNGCITQLKQRGKHGGVGYKDKVPGLADASMAAVGGWDIRPAKLGDALLRDQILDYDLVKQVKDDMNSKYTVFKGYYDSRFIGTSQHETATHILSPEEVPNASEALKCIRADIRYFKWKNGVVGHTTVIWSASVEPNSPFCVEGGGCDTAVDLLNLIGMSEEDRGGPLPPSLIYATAAILEGCSFVNGGSQNTLCGGLADLARQQVGVYCVGTDFKAGQTKFKTAAVEYLRTMGLQPKVIASSNHLGNNDMYNLATGDAARMAKLRVKHDIFDAWEEDIDHKVAVMYTPMINDEKRDFVEYTSYGYMNQVHTMVTYTRASDSVLCVPLMIDAAVWCDYFSRRSWHYENVAKALAYLFKVPEGAAKGVDPGFFRQMQELDHQVLAAAASSDATKKKSFTSEGRKSVKFKDSGEAERCRVTEWMIPHTANIVCAGLACVDMQLLQASGGDGGENIESFAGENTIGGGSVSMACKTLSRLCHGSPLDDDYMQVTPGVVNSIIPLCKIGTDDAGNKLLKLLEDAGSSCRNVDVSHLRKARKKDVNARTALAVLPIYKDGRRGCFFDAASNVDFTASDLVEMMEDFKEDESSIDKRGVSFGAFLFGYPHLLPKMQGEALAHILSKARLAMEDGGIIAVDLNGVPGDSDDASSSPWGSLCSVAYLQADPVLGPALSHIDILHMNEGEIGLLTGIHVDGTDSSEASDDIAISTAVSLFLKCGIAVVAVTRGKRGCYIACNNQQRFASSKMLPPSWAGCQVKVPATELPDGTEINSNGAGDAFTCGLLVAAMLRHTGLYIPLKSMVNDEKIDRKEDDSSDYKNNESQSMESELNNTTATSSNSSNIDTTNTSSSSSSAANNKKITPYTLYMKEKFVALKAELKGDKKAIFMKCHDMWENETEDVKEMYERKCREEESVVANNNVNDDTSSIMDQSLQSGEDEVMNSNDNDKNDDDGIVPSIDPRLANRTMNLETAAQFACLVAARHVDTSTRDLNYLDLDSLLAQSSVSQVGLEEI